MFAAVFSHWLLDVCVHRPDMGLYPFSGTELGFSGIFGGAGGPFEIGLTLALCAWYAVKARTARDHGGQWALVCVLVGVLYLLELLTVLGWVRQGYPAGMSPEMVSRLAR